MSVRIFYEFFFDWHTFCWHKIKKSVNPKVKQQNVRKSEEKIQIREYSDLKYIARVHCIYKRIPIWRTLNFWTYMTTVYTQKLSLP